MSEIGYHPNYDKYVEMIVAHPNYKGLYYDRDKDGKVNWVVTGKSPKGQMRQAWWDETCRKLGVPIQKGCYARVARLIHPTGKHVCQCCGKERSIFYEYPTKRTALIFDRILGTNIIDPSAKEEWENDERRAEHTIKELIEGWCNTYKQCLALADAFKVKVKPQSKDELIDILYKEYVEKCSSYFSPGVMSNPPDRYNGFHSYALCCRTKFDGGRKKMNMLTYIQDRRAYEDWSDGDYNLANRMMGEFHKQPPMACPICGNVEPMSADHIGPISLGFCHSRHFTPMCKSCNSAKNNRFTKSDVDELIALENKGSQVVSWHSKYIWDIVKNRIHNDIEAKQASSIMAKCHQNILNILAIIHQKTGREFLMRYLHPEYSMMDYRFENFDLKHLDRMVVRANPLDSKNKRNNQERYVRIAFESLEDFLAKDNRRNYFLISETSQELSQVLSAIRSKNYDLADRGLKELIREVSSRIYQIETGIKPYTYQEETYPRMVAESSEPYNKKG